MRGDEPFYLPFLTPTYKPGDTLQILGEAYEVKEVLPAYPVAIKETNVSSDISIDLRERGLKGGREELLQVWLKLQGPCRFIIRIEGAGGPVAGGYAGSVRYVDENVNPRLLNFFIYEDKTGILYVTATPIAIPAWFKIEAIGYLYKVSKTTKSPVSFPPYISHKR